MADQPISAAGAGAAAAAAAPQRQPRSGLARLRLALLVAAAALIALVVLLAITAWSVWRSDVSLPWLLQQVPGLQTQGVSGSLSGGDLTIRSLDWEISPAGGRLHVDDLVLRGVSIRLRRQPRLSGDLAMTSATARSVTFNSGPATSMPQLPPSHLRLPVSLQIDQLRVQWLQIDQAPAVRELAARVRLGTDNGSLHRVDRLRAVVEQAELSGQIQLGAEAPLPVSGQIQARQAQQERSTDGPAWAAQAQISNTLANLKLALQVQGTAPAGQPAPSLQAQASVQPWAAWPLGDLRLSAEHFDLASLSAQLPRTAISGQAQVTTQGLDQPAQAEVQLHNAQAGRLDLGRLPVRELSLSLAASPNQALQADRRQVVLRRFEMRFGDPTQAAGLASGSGQWRDGVLDLALVLTGVLPAKLDDRAAVVKVSGPLNLRWNAATVASTGQAVTAVTPVTPAKPDTAAKPASPAKPVQPDQSAGAMTGTMTGANLPWQLSGRLDGQALSPKGAALRLEFDAAASATHLVVRQARASAGQGRASFSGSARLDGISDPARPMRPASWHVVGRGQFDDFDPLPWWRGASASVWRTGGHRLDGELTTDLHWRTGPLTGPLVPAPTAALTGAPRGVNAAAAAPWLSRLDGWVQAKLGRSLLAGVPLTGQARLERRDGVAALQAALQSGASTLDLSAGRDAGPAARERATLSLKSPDLTTLAPLMRQVEAWLPGSTGALPSAGQLDARAEIDNQVNSLRSSGRLQAKGLISPLGQAGSIDLNWQAGWTKSADGSLRPGDEPLTLSLKSSALQRGAQRLERLDLELSGSLAEHRLHGLIESPARPPGWTEALFGPTGSGTRLELDGRGSWRGLAAGANRWMVQGMQLRASARNERGAAKPWLRGQDLAGELDLSASGLPTALRLSPGRIEVLNTALRWSQAEWHDGPRAGQQAGNAAQQMDLVGELETLNVASLLRQMQPNVGWSGNLTLGGRIEIHSGERLSADVLLDRRGGDLQVTDDLGGVQALGLTELRLSLGVHDGVWQFAQGLSGTQVGEMAGAQVVRTTPGQHWPPVNAPLQGVIQARVAKLEVWGHWVPPGWRLTGALQTSASFGGTFGAPEYSGRMQGQGLGLRNLIEGVALSDGELDLTLAGDRARIERFSFRGGEGRLDLTGEATLGGAPSANLALVASRFRLLGRIDRRVVVSGQTRLQLDAEQLKLDGRISIDEGLIDWTQGDAPALDSDVVITPRADVQTSAQSNAQSEQSELRTDPRADPRTDPRTLPAALRNAQVAVTIALGERLRLRGRGLDTGLRGELRFSSPGGRLWLDGTVKAVGGTYAAYGQKLEITRGDISFTSTVNNPRLDVLAVRPNLDVVVGVAITGSALQPRIRLVSQPEMAELDKLSWLVLGRSPDGLGRTDTALLQRAAIALLAGEGRAPTDELLSKLGLTDFSLRQTEGRCARDHHQPGPPVVASLVRGLRAQPECHQRHLAIGLPHRPALHLARPVRRRERARPDLVVALELSTGMRTGRLWRPWAHAKIARFAAVVQWIERAPPKR